MEHGTLWDMKWFPYVYLLIHGNEFEFAGWRGCMEASRKGLNALRNSHFPQDFTDWKRAKKLRESWGLVMLFVKVWTSR